MPVDAWAIDASGGAPAYDGRDLRLGATLPFVAGAGASLGVRSGVRPSGSGTDLLVQAQASPNMSVKINPGVIVAQGAISTTQGPYTWVNDTTLTRTIAAAHATLTRTDLVVVRIRDASIDTSGGRDGDVIVITGTAGGGIPSLPTDATYIEIARVAVGAGVSTIVAGNVTDRRPFTTGLGGVLPCTATTEPAANTVAPGQVAYRTDLGGQLRVSDGAAWAPLPGTHLARGNRLTTSATTTSEVGVLRVDNIPIVAGWSYRIWTDPLYLLTSGTGTAETVAALVRASTSGAATTSSAQVGNPVQVTSNNFQPPSAVLLARYDATVTGTLSVLLTVVRTGGTGSVSILGGSSDLLVECIGRTLADTGVDI